MKIPKQWQKESRSAIDASGKSFPLTAWGWGDTPDEARERAKTRLDALASKVALGKRFADLRASLSAPQEAYTYGRGPLREEILQELSLAGGDAKAIVTRNRYGAKVLNTDGVLILDIDLPASGGLGALLRAIGRKKSAEELALARLGELVQQNPSLAFRVYRTAAGLRAIETNTLSRVDSARVADWMRLAGADSLYITLCLSQQSYRARLSPKPWRIGLGAPPSQFPRQSAEQEQRFRHWLSEYEKRASKVAVCEYRCSLGTQAPAAPNRQLIELHDAATVGKPGTPLA